MSSYTINAIAIGIMLLWLHFIRQSLRIANETRQLAVESQILLAISALPLLAWLLEVFGLAWSAPSSPSASSDGWVSLGSVYWFVGWSGLSFARLGGIVFGTGDRMHPKTDTATKREADAWSPLQEASILSFGSIALVSFLCATWWVFQSYHYHQSFMLGFNDYGHFMQRVSNTANGRGFLLETPVLPIFWDHFNPGLALLVPLWKIYPDVTLAFYLQASALALSSLGIWFIARGTKCSPRESACWSLAWLCQPILGQMNLAYTYGWHPISLAIPLLLLAIACLQRRRWWIAVILTLLAMSMEEGVVVIVATYCAANAWLRFGWDRKSESKDRTTRALNPTLATELKWPVWFLLSVLATIGFVMVFKWSGLAEFQTARFASLGSTPLEVAASPVLRPNVFWGQLFSSRNAYFVLGLTIPCFLPALLLGWRTTISILPPLAVLLVWEHRPAASLAFQYSSILLPVLWLSSMQAYTFRRLQSADLASPEEIGQDATFLSAPTHAPNAAQNTAPKIQERNIRERKIGGWPLSVRALWQFDPNQAALGALATSFLFSLFLGQFPFISETLSDFRASSSSTSWMELSSETDQPARFPRESGSPDSDWIHGQLKVVQDSGLEVLATGRIASHLLGNREVETVGQFELRKEKLALLSGWPEKPIRHYRWLVVDRMETFQQTQQQTAEIEVEALQNGFTKLEERFGVAIYRNDAGF